MRIYQQNTIKIAIKRYLKPCTCHKSQKKTDMLENKYVRGTCYKCIINYFCKNRSTNISQTVTKKQLLTFSVWRELMVWNFNQMHTPMSFLEMTLECKCLENFSPDHTFILIIFNYAIIHFAATLNYLSSITSN